MQTFTISADSKAELLSRVSHRSFPVVNSALQRGSETQLIIQNEAEALQIINFLDYINHENLLTFPYYFDDNFAYNEVHQDRVNDFQLGTMSEIREALFEKFSNLFEN